VDLIRLKRLARGIEGFFLNSTHFDWTSREIRFGEQISWMTGGKNFVINTGENGRGPLVPADIVRQGNEVLCNRRRWTWATASDRHRIPARQRFRLDKQPR